ncbi:ABC transporter-like protein [Melioribacter roseus P3M-2]|uniref:ABC transporter-like protein n=1 Tax=Melioribacter roseus (strain DSM 23840 / JCM 17771 / VKM B-2668 / P3M-2) TaxID=1191523 RepID=I6YV63_MELRP|nr:ABC transporter ATP-binding protein [Melioribacter roseus]AFN74422.1 ABC transporter-like protein [Melioribacter roseus P3M-2]
MIEIKNLHKSFGGNKVLRGIDLTINTGESIAIIGKSGCGKSVLLKHIVGLIMPDEGDIIVDGNSVTNLPKEKLYDIRKRFGFLFQGAALFDSMTVFENVSLPLVENNYNFTGEEIEKLVEEKLSLVGLPGTENLKPSELSGGMKKRVGLARALITNPEYILYDEPTTGLDPVTSDSIDELIKELNAKLNVTSIIVTHDMFSVKKTAERIAMIHEGKIYFSGDIEEMLGLNDPVIKNFVKRTGF